MHQFDLKNKTAVITGGAQGFGLDIAKKFLSFGSKVFIWDIDEELLKSVVDEIKNPNLYYNLVDVSKYNEVETTVLKILANIGNYILLIFWKYWKSMLDKQGHWKKYKRLSSVFPGNIARTSWIRTTVFHGDQYKW